MANVILLATVAGFISSVFGGLIAIFISRPSKKFIGVSFSFVSAVLLTLVFVDFLPHAIGHGHYHVGIDLNGAMYQYWHQHRGAGIWLTVIGVLLGVGLVYILKFFDKYGHEHIHGIMPHNDHCSHDSLTKLEKRRLLTSAFTVAFAIILHDLPKGLAIGSAGSIMAAVLIGLSCIPEGMSIAIPLKAGGTKWWKIIGVCGLAGVATILGAIIGYLVGGINVYLSGIMFAIAAGCILGVVFSEIMPLSFEYADRTKWNFPFMIMGVLIVVTLNYFFHGLMY